MHQRAQRYDGGAGSPRNRRIRDADAYGRSLNAGSGGSMGGGGYYGGSGGGGGGSGGSTVALEIQSELVAALAKCEAALKAKTREAQQLRTQLTNARGESDMARKAMDADVAALQRDLDDAKDQSRRVGERVSEWVGE
jgi:hypothetical protein